MLPLKIIYIANIVVTGLISYSCLFTPQAAVDNVFSGTITYSEVIKLVGALWGAIFVLSILGLFFPQPMSLVLLFQLIYKSSWLLIVALPAFAAGKDFPGPMAMVFLIWVLVLPFFIPWKNLFSG